jgi:hypothetical protein
MLEFTQENIISHGDNFWLYRMVYFGSVSLDIEYETFKKLKDCVCELKEEKYFNIVFEDCNGCISIGYDSKKKQWMHESTSYGGYGPRGCVININITQDQLEDIFNKIKEFDIKN